MKHSVLRIFKWSKAILVIVSLGTIWSGVVSCDIGCPPENEDIPEFNQIETGVSLIHGPNLGGTFNGVYFTNPETGTVVGSNGLICRTTDGGIWWDTQNSGTNNSLNDVFFVNDTRGIVVGDNGTILTTEDGGSTWNKVESGTTENLTAVFFLTDVIGYAVGFDGVVLYTNDGGRSWARQGSVGEYCYGIWFADELNGVAFDRTGGHTGMITWNGGRDWSPINIPYKHPTAGTLILQVFIYDINSIDEKSAIAVGSAWPTDEDITIIKITDGIGSMRRINAPSGASGDLLSVSFVDSRNGIAVGEGGMMLKTTDGGETWEIIDSGTDGTLLGVFMIDKNTAIAVGEEVGIIIKEL